MFGISNHFLAGFEGVLLDFSWISRKTPRQSGSGRLPATLAGAAPGQFGAKGERQGVWAPGEGRGEAVEKIQRQVGIVRSIGRCHTQIYINISIITT